MSEPKPDALTIAQNALQAADRLARADRATGVIAVEVHYQDGAAKAVKVKTDKVVK